MLKVGSNPLSFNPHDILKNLKLSKSTNSTVVHKIYTILVLLDGDNISNHENVEDNTARDAENVEGRIKSLFI